MARAHSCMVANATQLMPVSELTRQVMSPWRYHIYLPVPPKATWLGGLGGMVSLAGGGAPGPRTGVRCGRPPGALSGLGAGVGVELMGVPMVGEDVGAGVFWVVPVEPTGTVLMVPGSSLRDGVG